MMLKVLTAAALVATANGAINWAINANGMCVGIDTECTDTASCTTTALGPCNADDTAPPGYVVSEFVGLAFVAPGYLSDTDNAKGTYKQIPPHMKGFRNYDANATDGNGGKYAYTMTGTVFGGDDTAWGYAGIASYFVNGNKDIKTQSNKIYGAAEHDSTGKSRTVGDNTNGAPNGPYDVCISKIDSTTGKPKCGAAMTYKPGDYKFSIFGAVAGKDWEKNTAAGQSGFPANQTHMGVRMKLQGYNYPFYVMLNGDKNITRNGETHVETMSLTTSDYTCDYRFPTNVNYGKIDALNDTIGAPMAVGDESGNVTIYVSQGPVDNSVYIDYLFPLNMVQKGDKYFIYDPNIKVKSKATTKGVAKGPANPGVPKVNGTNGAATAAAAVISTAVAIATAFLTM
jgi:hypothetical protein